MGSFSRHEAKSVIANQLGFRESFKHPLQEPRARVSYCFVLKVSYVAHASFPVHPQTLDVIENTIKSLTYKSTKMLSTVSPATITREKFL